MERMDTAMHHSPLPDILRSVRRLRLGGVRRLRNAAHGRLGPILP